MANRADRRRAVKEVTKVAEGLTPEALRQKAREYNQQAQQMLANFHRLTGAAIAYEEMAKGLEEAQRKPLALVPEKPQEQAKEEVKGG